ncbi:MAG: glycosyltransferase family 4 protein [Gammaproteobacteria bacterium]|nr:glycosyltransferase family 4 protein [Gammaproteobacteria bacterium]MCI0591418.1 glycosyltransferase family 4 protein [Gammaproteobacteria bacterium]
MNPKILYLVTEDWYFCSHRISLACAARDAGFDVVVTTRVNKHAEQIRKAGLKLVPIDFPRSGRYPWRDIRVIRSLMHIYRSERPDILHHVAMKPVLYGSAAALLTGASAIVNALTGLGYIFTSHHWRARLLRRLVKPALRILLSRGNSWVVLQNPDDQQMLTNAGLLKNDRVVVIKGSGVDMKKFSPSSEGKGAATVVLASRMLWDKGVREFVDAAQALRADGINARFVLVGETDAENPSAIKSHVLEQWQQGGVVEWWGRRDDMPAVFKMAHIVCLPSYREGLPKVLVEAAASGRPIVAADAPGCHEIVRDGENGFLVPARDSVALARALKHLIEDASLRKKMGERGRMLAVTEFSIDRVTKDTLDLYREILRATQIQFGSIRETGS